MEQIAPLYIVVAGRDRPGLVDEMRAIAPGARIAFVEESRIAEAIEDADIVATVRLPPAALARARRLRWVQSWAAGPNEILHDAMRRHDASLTSCKGNGAVPLAEHAMMLMLMLARDARRLLEAQARSRWDRYLIPELAGRTCGIVGVGHSGSDLARKARAFGMRVVGLRRQDLPAEGFDHVYTRSGLGEFLAQSDFVVVTAALTQASTAMLGEAEFRAMKRSAFYVCVSRGGIADPDALARALAERRIAGAGLDAHAIEPLPADSPFWTMPNVIVTPHIGSISAGTVNRGIDIFLENLRRFVAGRPLVNVVDKEAGY
jgi:phosphoglycerate dehydrogenase-like enzyme